MDLLATVRKEGSRGGRADFKWSDVQASSHRENYLGHSLMAPVGRWQKGRDLGWYAKGDNDTDNPDEDPATKAARERKEEIRRVKEAEEDALARALGLPVAPRNNPNMEELGGQREVGRVLKEAAEGDDAVASRGVGYGRAAGIAHPNVDSPSTERIAGTSNPSDNELENALKEYKRRHGEQEPDGGRRRRRRSRSRSRSRGHDREHRRRRDGRDRHRESHRDRERHNDQRPRRRRSFSAERQHHERSRSPRNGREEAPLHRTRDTHRSSDRQKREGHGRHDDRRRHDRA